MEDAQVNEQPKKEETNHPFDQKHFHPDNSPSVWSIILIIIGIYFLLSNFNIVSRELVSGIVRAWPALLIFWGIDMYTKDKPKLRTPAIVILVMLVVFLILTFSDSYIPYFR